MFEKLGGIFPVKPRETEKSDTRQDIRRHDPEFERNAKREKSLDDENARDENAIIGVEALLHFLDDIVKDKAHEQDKNAPNALSQNPSKAPHNYPPAPITEEKFQASRAAGAYQHVAKANNQPDVLLETTDQAQGPSLDLASADIRIIHVLIKNVALLHEAHVEHLTLEPAATFLDSLQNAVEHARLALSL